MLRIVTVLNGGNARTTIIPTLTLNNRITTILTVPG
jgi:hypothetical protein